MKQGVVNERKLLQRMRQRRNERGMAVFLVVLVLTVVSTIGMFSMHSASLVDRATGFNRQNVQATAMVEFAARGAGTWLGINKNTVFTEDRIVNCAADLLAASVDAKCAVLPEVTLQELFAEAAPTAFSNGLTGLLNSPHDATAIRAEVATEMTEAFDANARTRPGSAGGTKEMTFTTQARIYPTGPGSLTSCGAGARGAMSQQRLRAHVIIQL